MSAPIVPPRRLRSPAAILIALGALLASSIPASPAAGADAGSPVEVHVRYVSADYVYLDAGTAKGLAVGDSLAVTHGQTTVATVQVVYVTELSASCRVVSSTGTVLAGDSARLLRAPGAAAPSPPAAGAQAAPGWAPAPTATAPATVAAPPTPVPPPAPGAEVSGYAALQWYHYSDRSSAGLSYDEPAVRLYLKARRLWGRPITFEMRGRVQHDWRAHSFSDRVPSREWSNRVYQFSLAYDDPDAAVTWQAGRIISNAIAATGPVDGLLLESRFSAAFRGGVFGGTLPDFSNTAPRSSLQKYGVYVRGASGDYGGRRWAAAAAATAEYHGSTVSRQYLYLQSQWQSGPRFSFYEGAELDLNNGWRRAGAPGSVSLTNLYLTGSYRPSTGSTMNLTYDSRRNFRSWDNRSLADSLFDDALRHGLRGMVSLRLAPRWQAFANGGWRGRQGGGDNTWSWGGGLSRDGVLGAGLRVTAQANGFHGPRTSGLNPSLTLLKAFPAGHSLGLSGGFYRYKFGVLGARRTNSWLQVDATRRLTARLYMTGQYQHDWGDDVRGERFLAELGVNF